MTKFYRTIYLITFPNVFEHARFKDNIEKYFSNINDVTVIAHNRVFCEVSTKYNWQFYVKVLKQNFPGIKIIGKQQLNNKLRYTEL